MSHPFHDGTDPHDRSYPRHLNEDWLVGTARDYGEDDDEVIRPPTLTPNAPTLDAVLDKLAVET